MPETPRQRRLRNDLLALEQLRAESTILDFIAYGNPPEAYRLYFRGRGLHRPEGVHTPQVRDLHEVSLMLGATYPRGAPALRWETPVFHPNVSQSGVVCTGGFGTFWTPSVTMDQLCEMLWNMARYANFNAQSAYNRAAADWAKAQGAQRFPLDFRVLRDRVAAGQRELASSPWPLPPPRAAHPVVMNVSEVPDEVVVAELIEEPEPEILYIG